MLNINTLKKINQFIVFLTVFLAGSLVFAVQPPLPEPLIQAKAAILMDYNTGAILYEKNADQIIPPASLTKLMTLHLACRQLESNRLRLGEQIIVPEKAAAYRMPVGSSLMFLESGQKVSVYELMLGLAVDSGNDAAHLLAIRMAGSVDNFVIRMNAEAKRMGLRNMHFIDPAGFDDHNQITAREFGAFCREYVCEHPEMLERVHSVRTFSYPQEHNLTRSVHRRQHSWPIKQYNHNKLLWSYEGADGLKTGYIHASGYNIAVTAKREDQRLIVVLLGAQSRRSLQNDAKELMDFGFENYMTIEQQMPVLASVRVISGSKNWVRPRLANSGKILIPRNLDMAIRYQVTPKTYLVAPIKRGDVVGEVVFYAGKKQLCRVNMVSSVNVPKGNAVKCLLDNMFRNT